MTIMIPPTVHSTVKSAAERRLFRVIQDAPQSDSWVCLHSLGLARHEYKRRAEIDFCLITPRGIYVLEVKGGRVSRKAGLWTFTDRYGVEHTKRESPFEQASSAMFALERDLKKRFAGDAPAAAIFGYGVLFPDIEFNDIGTEAAQEQVFDRRDRRKPFSDYIARLARYTQSRQNAEVRRLDKKHIDDVVSYLRGDFDLIPPIGQLFDESRAQLSELTNEQMTVLDVIKSYDRVIVEGPAGSGKTLLALESARRDARVGKHVALICYNRKLSAMIESQIQDEEFSGVVTVRSIYGLFNDVIGQSSLAEEYLEEKGNVDDRTIYESLAPDYAALAAMELASPPYDALIVDEAQDVLTAPSVRALSELVKGGLENGCWRLFLDGNDQACVYGRMDTEVFAHLRTLSDREPLLTLNCRNTKPIGMQINVVAQPSHRTLCRAEGPPVEFFTYGTEEKLLGKLEQVLNMIRGMKVPPGSVSVLLPEAPSESRIDGLKRLGVVHLREEEVRLLGRKELTRCTWASVSGFKGLENDVVVLIGIRELESEWWRAVNYVGLSRARIRLFVIVHESCDSIREERFAEELARSFDTQEEEL